MAVPAFKAVRGAEMSLVGSIPTPSAYFLSEKLNSSHCEESRPRDGTTWQSHSYKELNVFNPYKSGADPSAKLRTSLGVCHPQSNRPHRHFLRVVNQECFFDSVALGVFDAGHLAKPGAADFHYIKNVFAGMEYH